MPATRRGISGNKLASSKSRKREAPGECPAPPHRFQPPVTSVSMPDRNPRDGLRGTITFGDPAAGSGSFVRYAKALGMECSFLAEQDMVLGQMAASEAGEGVQLFGSVFDTHPSQLPHVNVLIAGPECQPFSTIGMKKGTKDRRARTFFWIIWCLALRQFESAFIENVTALIDMDGGREWSLLKSLLEAVGYVVQVRRD